MDPAPDMDWITVGNKNKSKGSENPVQPTYVKRDALSALRLSKELKNLARSPLDGICAAPLDDNLLEWHVTISVSSGVLEGGLFHFVLDFPSTYPGKPPRVIPATGVPHSHCERKGQQWQICSDLLQTQGWENEEGKAYKGWSSAYTLESILLQLQLLLLTASNATGQITAAEAKERARDYVCAGCGHRHDAPRPEPLKKDENEQATQITVLPTQPQVVVSHNEYEKLTLLGAAERASQGWSTLVQPEKSNPWETSKKQKPEEKNPEEKKPKPAIELIPNGQRFDIGMNVKCPIPQRSTAPPSLSETLFAAKILKDNGSGEVLVQYTDKELSEQDVPFLRAIIPRSRVQPIGCPPVPVKPGQKLSLKQRVWSPVPKRKGLEAKRFRGHFRAHVLKDNGSSSVLVQFCDDRLTEKDVPFLRAIVLREQLMLPTEKPAGVTIKRNTPPSVLGSNDVSSASGDSNEELTVDPFANAKSGISKGDTVLTRTGQSGTIVDIGTGRIFGVMFEGADKMEMVNRGRVVYWKRAQGIVIEGASGVSAAGACRILELGVTSLFSIFEFLSVSDLARSACVCKAFKRYSEDGFLWRSVFARRFSKSALTPGALSSWKHLFALETEQIFDQLVCFQTKKTFGETQLGIPIVYTVNPKKNIIDYMFSTCDLISQEAYSSYKVRKTKWQESFTHWLPLYITYDHFKRAQPAIEKSLCILSKLADPLYWTANYARKFRPAMAIEILPKLMKTFTVLIADKGIANLETALLGYVSLHRLFIALCLEYPALRRLIDEKIENFLKRESNRSKECLRDLGEFVPLLSVSDKYSWAKVVPKLVEESFDRGVLWVCKDHPELHNANVKTNRLEKTYASTKISRRFMMFQGYFARTFKGERTIFELARYYDRYYGRPSRADMKDVKSDIEKLLDASADTSPARGWHGYFKALGLSTPSPAGLTRMLCKAVTNSKRRKYTKGGMRFDKIHSSGVSKLLMKGESYSINPSAKTISVEDLWTCPNGFDYLDAAVILLDKNHERVAISDYRRRTVSGKGGRTAIEHSGDIIDGDHGKHTIKIDLDFIDDRVARLVFVASAFRGDFDDIAEPYLRLCDEQGSELCRHDVAKLISDNPIRSLCIFGEMRRTPKKAAKWEFIAHSKIGDGTVRHYEPIIQQIPKCDPKLFS